MKTLVEVIWPYSKTVGGITLQGYVCLFFVEESLTN